MQLRLIEYGVRTARIFNDTTPFPGYAPTSPEHPMLAGLPYIDKHTQPSNDPCMASVLEAHYGHMDVAAAIELVSRLQTGDIHLAIYDFVANTVYASVASAVRFSFLCLSLSCLWLALCLTLCLTLARPVSDSVSLCGCLVRAHVSQAAPVINAYDNLFFKFDMTSLFSLPPPS